eukprot:CAMPEP_0195319012 /NCGR_PEP_ID=MMETSP0708-20121125/5237_1 /TAXON_ID=33640 /ORGANISM="Asterionellopsis glacialis, Strain CCMP134" /LENGTH=77 /DNA_ID=CAMNT_0040385115 /DNA_START=61 /DNA_END=294 /DNA_ORIENTATION=-
MVERASSANVSGLVITIISGGLIGVGHGISTGNSSYDHLKQKAFGTAVMGIGFYMASTTFFRELWAAIESSSKSSSF